MASSNSYMREYMRERFHRNRARGLKILGGKCAECAETEELQFDHKDPNSKYFSSSRMFHLGEKRFLEEVAKCQLLCSVHHELKTLDDLGRVSAKNRHGTLSTYKYCHCAACRAAKSEYMTNWRLGR